MGSTIPCLDLTPSVILTSSPTPLLKMKPERDTQELSEGRRFGDGEVIFYTLLDIRATFLYFGPIMLKKKKKK